VLKRGPTLSFRNAHAQTALDEREGELKKRCRDGAFIFHFILKEEKGARMTSVALREVHNRGSHGAEERSVRHEAGHRSSREKTWRGTPN